MQQDGAAVALLVDKVDGGTGHLAAPGQSSLMGAQAVHAGPTEGRDERRVNIQDAAGIGFNDTGAQHGKEPGQHHQIDVVAFQRFQQGRVKFLAGGVVLAADHNALHTGFCSPLQRKDTGLGGYHQRNFTIGVLAPGFAVQQGLQIGAAARNKHSYVQHSSTPSPSAMTPSL